MHGSSVARKPKTPRWLQAARTRNASPVAKPDWLSRALARAGALPLKEAEAAIAEGRVRVDGKKVLEPFSPLRPDSKVTLDGHDVEVAAATRVVLFHKPAGVVTSDHDPKKVGTVFQRLGQVLPPELQNFGWHAVGRLDRDTTGLLLFTNDERFVAHATSPESRLEKRYVARVSGQITEEKLAQLRTGVELEDGVTRPAGAKVREDGRVELTLTEGRNHQVKRMLGALGMPVLELHREAIGTLVLDVPEGGCRLLSDDEVETFLRYTPRRG
jgi:pseudouridine synthase